MGIIEWFDDLNISSKLLAYSILLIIIPITAVGYLSYISSKEAIYIETENKLSEQVFFVEDYISSTLNNLQDKVRTNLEVAQRFVYLYGVPGLDAQGNIILDLKDTYNVDTYVINGDTELVNLIEETLGGSATIYQLKEGSLVSVSSTINSDIRAPAMVYESIMQDKTYLGRSQIANEWHWIGYQPLKDSKGTIIGAISVSVAEHLFLEPVKQTIDAIKVGETGYVFVLDSRGNYIVSDRMQRNGENIIDSKDDDGRLFIQEMIRKSVQLEESQYDTILYPWQNPGEPEPREKFVVLGYYKELDWVIGSGVYQDEFERPIDRIKNITLVVSLFSVLFGISISYILQKNISQPLQAVTGAFNSLAAQDYTKKIDIKPSKSEIGQLVDAYNKVVQSTHATMQKIKENMDNVAAIAERLSSSSEEVNASTQQVASTIQQIAKGSQSQSMQVEVTDKVVSELNSSIEKISKSIRTAANSATVSIACYP